MAENGKDKYKDSSREDLLKVVEKLEARKKYGLIWDEEKVKEQFEKDAENALPILKEIKRKEIKTSLDEPINILIEGDNYHALSVLNFTHLGKIDLIYIDPPYNTGKKDFKYNDSYVDEEDSFRHSKWLSFMSKRLKLAKNLLKEDGLFIAHIDEHEHATLQLLLEDLFGEKNNLGAIVWDKKNPKGDAKGIASQHEYLLVYAKDAEQLFKTKKIVRAKDNAQKILKKAEEFFRKIDKVELPDDLNKIVKKYKISSEITDKFKIKFNLEYINEEFYKWLKNQNFSGGETAYSKIDNNGDVFRLVSMAWPNKKKAPDDYFVPLIHPRTGKACAIPSRGWRNSLIRMKELIEQNLIVFGEDESVQPQRKYLLKENMSENIPSIIGFGGSNDKLLEEMGIEFENPKPIDFCKKIIQWFSNENGVVLDFFAGSGSVGHSIAEMNKNSNNKRAFILCTNNELNGAEKMVLSKKLNDAEAEEFGICRRATYSRIKKVLEGYKSKNGELIKGTGGRLKYFKTAFIKKTVNGDDMKIKLTRECTEMLCIREGVFDENKKTDEYSIFEQNGHIMAVYYSIERKGLKELKKELDKMKGEKTLYCFTLDPLGLDKSDFTSWKDTQLEPIPQKILEVYEEIYEY